jgi:transcriptional regulator with PAS, ATPase and Fis domain
MDPSRPQSSVTPAPPPGAPAKADAGPGAARRLLGGSEAIRRLIREAENVARCDVTVLIEGESGTGKELVAELIHRASARRAKPFVGVNCAALAETLVEAEFFGHAKGAFTGAIADKPGRFHLADGGTLFLDEIADLGPHGQGALLRVLEDGAFRKVGGTALQRVDVRIVAATHRRLTDAVAAGTFREDLFYRLEIVPLMVPPLRARPDDVPLLLEAFIAEFAARHGRARPELPAAAWPVCQAHPWPGNVRQLRNFAERLVIHAAGRSVEPGELPVWLQGAERAAGGFAVRAGMTIAEAEKELIRATLARTPHRAQAAAQLGISRRALQYKLKAYGLLAP